LKKLIDAAMTQRLDGLFTKAMTPDYKQQQIDRNIAPNWIGKVLNVVLGNDTHTDISIDNQQQLVITRRRRRHGQALKQFGFAVFLDATADRRDLARAIGVDFDAIVSVRQQRPDFANLSVAMVRGLGAAGRQRRNDSRYSVGERIKVAVQAIVAKHANAKIGLIDYKDCLKDYQIEGAEIIPGYWFRDNRGSNAYADCDVLIAVGSPAANLGQMAANWHARIGEVVVPADFSGRYGAWLRSQIRAEVLQAIGRLRAHRQADREKHVYLLSDNLSNSATAEAIVGAFPGVAVKATDAYDLAPQAATKGEQTARGIVEGVWRAIAEGTDITGDKLAHQLGQTKSNVTKALKTATGKGLRWLKQSLLLLYRSLYNKIQLSDLDIPDDARWVAEHYLGILLDAPEADVAAELWSIYQGFGAAIYERIIAAAPAYVLTGLIARLLRHPHADKLRSQLREAIEAIPIAA
jgi:hypothetical protein